VGAPPRRPLGGVRPPTCVFSHLMVLRFSPKHDEGHLSELSQRGYQLRLFSRKEPSDPQLDLKGALEPLESRLTGLELLVRDLRAEWVIVSSHVDQQTKKVHRELGHVSRMRSEQSDGEQETQSSLPRRQSRYRGGRNR